MLSRLEHEFCFEMKSCHLTSDSLALSSLPKTIEVCLFFFILVFLHHRFLIQTYTFYFHYCVSLSYVTGKTSSNRRTWMVKQKLMYPHVRAGDYLQSKTCLQTTLCYKTNRGCLQHPIQCLVTYVANCSCPPKHPTDRSTVNNVSKR